MRPVSSLYRISQPFGSMRTAGVVASSNPASGVGYYVYLYGNYQPYGHAGCDIACPEGTPVHAIASGTVLWADWGTNLPGDESNAGYRRRWYLYKKFPGIVTVIQHAGWVGVYAHLSRAQMNVGDRVAEAQQIGLSGGTGGVAPHLHVEALVDLNYTTSGGLIYGRTNPEPYFKSAGMAAMSGTITPQAFTEEDDMSEADSKNIEKIVHRLETAIGMLDSVAGGVNGVPSAILDKQVPRANSADTTSLALYLSYADADRDATVARIQSAIAATPAPELAAQIDAAGLAASVRDELVKLLAK